MHTVAAPAVRAAIKTQLSYRNDSIEVFFFSLQLTKTKAMFKLLWLLLTNLTILSLIWREKRLILFEITRLVYILPGDTRRAMIELPDASKPSLVPN